MAAAPGPARWAAARAALRELDGVDVLLLGQVCDVSSVLPLLASLLPHIDAVAGTEEAEMVEVVLRLVGKLLSYVPLDVLGENTSNIMSSIVSAIFVIMNTTKIEVLQYLKVLLSFLETIIRRITSWNATTFITQDVVDDLVTTTNIIVMRLRCIKMLEIEKDRCVDKDIINSIPSEPFMNIDQKYYDTCISSLISCILFLLSSKNSVNITKYIINWESEKKVDEKYVPFLPYLKLSPMFESMNEMSHYCLGKNIMQICSIVINSYDHTYPTNDLFKKLCQKDEIVKFLESGTSLLEDKSEISGISFIFLIRYFLYKANEINCQFKKVLLELSDDIPYHIISELLIIDRLNGVENIIDEKEMNVLFSKCTNQENLNKFKQLISIMSLIEQYKSFDDKLFMEGNSSVSIRTPKSPLSSCSMRRIQLSPNNFDFNGHERYIGRKYQKFNRTKNFDEGKDSLLISSPSIIMGYTKCVEILLTSCDVIDKMISKLAQIMIDEIISCLSSCDYTNYVIYHKFSLYFMDNGAYKYFRQSQQVTQTSKRISQFTDVFQTGVDNRLIRYITSELYQTFSKAAQEKMKMGGSVIQGIIPLMIILSTKIISSSNSHILKRLSLFISNVTSKRINRYESIGPESFAVTGASSKSLYDNEVTEILSGTTSKREIFREDTINFNNSILDLMIGSLVILIALIEESKTNVDELLDTLQSVFSGIENFFYSDKPETFENSGIGFDSIYISPDSLISSTTRDSINFPSPRFPETPRLFSSSFHLDSPHSQQASSPRFANYDLMYDKEGGRFQNLGAISPLRYDTTKSSFLGDSSRSFGKKGIYETTLGYSTNKLKSLEFHIQDAFSICKTVLKQSVSSPDIPERCLSVIASAMKHSEMCSTDFGKECLNMLKMTGEMHHVRPILAECLDSMLKHSSTGGILLSNSIYEASLNIINTKAEGNDVELTKSYDISFMISACDSITRLLKSGDKPLIKSFINTSFKKLPNWKINPGAKGLFELSSRINKSDVIKNSARQTKNFEINVNDIGGNEQKGYHDSMHIVPWSLFYLNQISDIITKSHGENRTQFVDLFNTILRLISSVFSIEISDDKYLSYDYINENFPLNGFCNPINTVLEVFPEVIHDALHCTLSVATKTQIPEKIENSKQTTYLKTKMIANDNLVEYAMQLVERAKISNHVLYFETLKELINWFKELIGITYISDLAEENIGKVDVICSNHILLTNTYRLSKNPEVLKLLLSIPGNLFPIKEDIIIEEGNSNFNTSDHCSSFSQYDKNCDDAQIESEKHCQRSGTTREGFNDVLYSTMEILELLLAINTENNGAIKEILGYCDPNYPNRDVSLFYNELVKKVLTSEGVSFVPNNFVFIPSDRFIEAQRKSVSYFPNVSSGAKGFTAHIRFRLNQVNVWPVCQVATNNGPMLVSERGLFKVTPVKGSNSKNIQCTIIGLYSYSRTNHVIKESIYFLFVRSFNKYCIIRIPETCFDNWCSFTIVGKYVGATKIIALPPVIIEENSLLNESLSNLKIDENAIDNENDNSYTNLSYQDSTFELLETRDSSAFSVDLYINGLLYGKSVCCNDFDKVLSSASLVNSQQKNSENYPLTRDTSDLAENLVEATVKNTNITVLDVVSCLYGLDFTIRQNISSINSENSDFVASASSVKGSPTLAKQVSEIGKGELSRQCISLFGSSLLFETPEQRPPILLASFKLYSKALTSEKILEIAIEESLGPIVQSGPYSEKNYSNFYELLLKDRFRNQKNIINMYNKVCSSGKITIEDISNNAKHVNERDENDIFCDYSIEKNCLTELTYFSSARCYKKLHLPTSISYMTEVSNRSCVLEESLRFASLLDYHKRGGKILSFKQQSLYLLSAKLNGFCNRFFSLGGIDGLVFLINRGIDIVNKVDISTEVCSNEEGNNSYSPSLNVTSSNEEHPTPAIECPEDLTKMQKKEENVAISNDSDSLEKGHHEYEADLNVETNVIRCELEQEHNTQVISRISSMCSKNSSISWDKKGIFDEKLTRIIEKLLKNLILASNRYLVACQECNKYEGMFLILKQLCTLQGERTGLLQFFVDELVNCDRIYCTIALMKCIPQIFLLGDMALVNKLMISIMGIDTKFLVKDQIFNLVQTVLFLVQELQTKEIETESNFIAGLKSCIIQVLQKLLNLSEGQEFVDLFIFSVSWNKMWKVVKNRLDRKCFNNTTIQLMNSFVQLKNLFENSPCFHHNDSNVVDGESEDEFSNKLEELNSLMDNPSVWIEKNIGKVDLNLLPLFTVLHSVNSGSITAISENGQKVLSYYAKLYPTKTIGILSIGILKSIHSVYFTEAVMYWLLKFAKGQKILTNSNEKHKAFDVALIGRICKLLADAPNVSDYISDFVSKMCIYRATHHSRSSICIVMLFLVEYARNLCNSLFESCREPLMNIVDPNKSLISYWKLCSVTLNETKRFTKYLCKIYKDNMDIFGVSRYKSPSVSIDMNNVVIEGDVKTYNEMETKDLHSIDATGNEGSVCGFDMHEFSKELVSEIIDKTFYPIDHKDVVISLFLETCTLVTTVGCALGISNGISDLIKYLGRKNYHKKADDPTSAAAASAGLIVTTGNTNSSGSGSASLFSNTSSNMLESKIPTDEYKKTEFIFQDNKNNDNNINNNSSGILSGINTSELIFKGTLSSDYIQFAKKSKGVLEAHLHNNYINNHNLIDEIKNAPPIIQQCFYLFEDIPAIVKKKQVKAVSKESLDCTVELLLIVDLFLSIIIQNDPKEDSGYNKTHDSNIIESLNTDKHTDCVGSHDMLNNLVETQISMYGLLLCFEEVFLNQELTLQLLSYQLSGNNEHRYLRSCKTLPQLIDLIERIKKTKAERNCEIHSDIDLQTTKKQQTSAEKELSASDSITKMSILGSGDARKWLRNQLLSYQLSGNNEHRYLRSCKTLPQLIDLIERIKKTKAERNCEIHSDIDLQTTKKQQTSAEKELSASDSITKMSILGSGDARKWLRNQLLIRCFNVTMNNFDTLVKELVDSSILLNVDEIDTTSINNDIEEKHGHYSTREGLEIAVMGSEFSEYSSEEQSSTEIDMDVNNIKNDGELRNDDFIGNHDGSSYKISIKTPKGCEIISGYLLCHYQEQESVRSSILELISSFESLCNLSSSLLGSQQQSKHGTEKEQDQRQTSSRNLLDGLSFRATTSINSMNSDSEKNSQLQPQSESAALSKDNELDLGKYQNNLNQDKSVGALAHRVVERFEGVSTSLWNSFAFLFHFVTNYAALNMLDLNVYEMCTINLVSHGNLCSSLQYDKTLESCKNSLNTKANNMLKYSNNDSLIRSVPRGVLMTTSVGKRLLEYRIRHGNCGNERKSSTIRYLAQLDFPILGTVFNTYRRSSPYDAISNTQMVPERLAFVQAAEKKIVKLFLFGDKMNIGVTITHPQKLSHLCKLGVDCANTSLLKYLNVRSTSSAKLPKTPNLFTTQKVNKTDPILTSETSSKTAFSALSTMDYIKSERIISTKIKSTRSGEYNNEKIISGYSDTIPKNCLEIVNSNSNNSSNNNSVSSNKWSHTKKEKKDREDEVLESPYRFSVGIPPTQFDALCLRSTVLGYEPGELIVCYPYIIFVKNYKLLAAMKKFYRNWNKILRELIDTLIMKTACDYISNVASVALQQLKSDIGYNFSMLEILTSQLCTEMKINPVLYKDKEELSQLSTEESDVDSNGDDKPMEVDGENENNENCLKKSNSNSAFSSQINLIDQIVDEAKNSDYDCDRRKRTSSLCDDIEYLLAETVSVINMSNITAIHERMVCNINCGIEIFTVNGNRTFFVLDSYRMMKILERAILTIPSNEVLIYDLNGEAIDYTEQNLSFLDNISLCICGQSGLCHHCKFQKENEHSYNVKSPENIKRSKSLGVYSIDMVSISDIINRSIVNDTVLDYALRINIYGKQKYNQMITTALEGLYDTLNLQQNQKFKLLTHINVKINMLYQLSYHTIMLGRYTDIIKSFFGHRPDKFRFNDPLVVKLYNGTRKNLGVFLPNSKTVSELSLIVTNNPSDETRKKTGISGGTKEVEFLQISNYDLLKIINTLAGRSPHDSSQLPVFPLLLSDRATAENSPFNRKLYIPATNTRHLFRDLKYPLGIQRIDRFIDLLIRFVQIHADNEATLIPLTQLKKKYEEIMARPSRHSTNMSSSVTASGFTQDPATSVPVVIKSTSTDVKMNEKDAENAYKDSEKEPDEQHESDVVVERSDDTGQDDYLEASKSMQSDECGEENNGNDVVLHFPEKENINIVPEKDFGEEVFGEIEDIKLSQSSSLEITKSVEMNSLIKMKQNCGNVVNSNSTVMNQDQRTSINELDISLAVDTEIQGKGENKQNGMESILPCNLNPGSVSTMDVRKSHVSRTQELQELEREVHSIIDKIKMSFKCTDNIDGPALQSTFYSNTNSGNFLLMRLEPYTSGMKLLQGGDLDTTNRLFNSITQHCKLVFSSNQHIIEMTDITYSTPLYLVNLNGLDIGLKYGKQFDGSNVVIEPQDVDSSSVITAENEPESTKLDCGNVVLPNWAKSPQHYLTYTRSLMESTYVTTNIHKFINLIFGSSQYAVSSFSENQQSLSQQVMPSKTSSRNVRYRPGMEINDNIDINVRIPIYNKAVKMVATTLKMQISPFLLEKPLQSSEVPGYIKSIQASASSYKDINNVKITDESTRVNLHNKALFNMYSFPFLSLNKIASWYYVKRICSKSRKRINSVGYVDNFDEFYHSDEYRNIAVTVNKMLCFGISPMKLFDKPLPSIKIFNPNTKNNKNLNEVERFNNRFMSHPISSNICYMASKALNNEKIQLDSIGTSSLLPDTKKIALYNDYSILLNTMSPSASGVGGKRGINLNLQGNKDYFSEKRAGFENIDVNSCDYNDPDTNVLLRCLCSRNNLILKMPRLANVSINYNEKMAKNNLSIHINTLKHNVTNNVESDKSTHLSLAFLDSAHKSSVACFAMPKNTIQLLPDMPIWTDGKVLSLPSGISTKLIVDEMKSGITSPVMCAGRSWKDSDTCGSNYGALGFNLFTTTNEDQIAIYTAIIDADSLKKGKNYMKSLNNYQNLGPAFTSSVDPLSRSYNYSYIMTCVLNNVPIRLKLINSFIPQVRKSNSSAASPGYGNMMYCSSIVSCHKYGLLALIMREKNSGKFEELIVYDLFDKTSRYESLAKCPLEIQYSLISQDLSEIILSSSTTQDEENQIICVQNVSVKKILFYDIDGSLIVYLVANVLTQNDKLRKGFIMRFGINGEPLCCVEASSDITAICTVPYIPGREPPMCIYSERKHNTIRMICVDEDHWNPTISTELVIKKEISSPNRIKQLVLSKCGRFILVLREIKGSSSDSSVREKEIVVEQYSVRIPFKRRIEW